jgi:hypothetical protein
LFFAPATKRLVLFRPAANRRQRLRTKLPCSFGGGDERPIAIPLMNEMFNVRYSPAGRRLRTASTLDYSQTFASSFEELTLDG